MMQKEKHCIPSLVGMVLVIVGAINWGLVGVGNFLGSNWNLVNLIFRRVDWLESVIYILVGLAGIVLVFGCHCKKCNTDSCCGGHDGGSDNNAPTNDMN